jgi:hypothetical protein
MNLANHILRKENDMKKTISILALAFVMGLAFSIPEGKAQMGSGMMGGGMMGGGMMGRGMGPGTIGPGYRNEYGPQYSPQYRQPQKQLEENDARAILGNYLKSTRNPNLKLGKIEDKGNAFEAEILTKNDSLVDRILVDKNNGGMHSAY